MSTAVIGGVTGATAHAPRRGAGRTRLRLTRRGRLVVTALVAAPLALGAGIAAVNGGGATASASHSAVSFQYVTIRSGQSLWDVAERVAPQADPRDVVAGIVALNQLDGATVVPGERLAIPQRYR